MINCECHDSRMVAQQRKEILMLTAELTNQSNEIENQIARNNKLRNKIKTNEKEKHDFECRVRSLLKEISTLKDERSKFDAELDSIKKSLVKKDQLIQSQSVKYQQLSIDCERFKKQLAEYQTKNNELKAENLKLKQTVKDQSNKVAETKIKENELLKIIENKNELIKLSANQIKLLEGNLTNLANMMIVSNSQKCDLSSSNKQSAASSIQDNNNNSKEILVTTPKTPIKEDNMQPNNNNVQDEIHVNSLIKSLKETWLESNLKYEEIKNLIISRLPTQGQLVANNNNNRSSTPTSDQI